MKFYRMLHRVGAEFGNTSVRQVAIGFDLALDWLLREGTGDMSHPLPLPLYPVPTAPPPPSEYFFCKILGSVANFSHFLPLSGPLRYFASHTLFCRAPP